MDLSVVIPIYNEEIAIRKNVFDIVGTLNRSGLVWELILVNDGSKDNTLKIIKGIGRGIKEIKIVSYPNNRGRGFAIRRGFEIASGKYIVTTESDLNWGSEIIPRFVEELKKGDCDMIIASPHAKGGGMKNVPFFRWLVSYLGNVAFSLTMPKKLTMYTGMTRGYRREAIKSLLPLESDRKEIHIEIIYKMLDRGHRVKEIPAILSWQIPKKGEIVRKSHFKMSSVLLHLKLLFNLRKWHPEK